MLARRLNSGVRLLGPVGLHGSAVYESTSDNLNSRIEAAIHSR